MPRNYPLPAVPSHRSPVALRRCRGRLLAAIGLTTMAWLQGGGARSEDLFAAQPLDESRFAVLGRPVARDDWNLLVLEQVAEAPRCWTSRPDGLVDPTLNRFNFTGICNRYIDSNGYSLRVGEQDLASSYRLRLVQVGDELRLLASTVTSPSDLLVGRGRVPLRDRDGFVQLSLEPGWTLQRRSYQGRGLSHLYFANNASLPALLAQLQPATTTTTIAGRADTTNRGARGSTLLSRLGSIGGTGSVGAARTSGGTRSAGALPQAAVATRGPLAIPGQPVPLEVIPFRE